MIQIVKLKRGSRNPRLVVACAVVIACAVSGCAAPPPTVVEHDGFLDPIVEESGDAIIVEVDSTHPLAVQIEGLGRITAPSHAFSAAGQIVIQPLSSSTGGGAAITTDGPGFDLTLRGTHIVSPLTIYFDDPAIAQELPDGAIPLVAHLPDGGAWETKEIQFTPDGVPYLITDEFSPNLFGWFALPDWLTDLPGAMSRWATTSFPARECIGGGPSWAKVFSTPDIVHSCLISNIDASSGAVRAEVQIQSNRDRFQWVRVPSGYDYLWVDGQPAEVRSAIAQFSGRSTDSYVLLGPNQWMTAGYRQPIEGQGTRELVFQVSGDDQTNGLNLLRGIMDVAIGELPNAGSWAHLLVLAFQCRDDLGDAGSLALCVVEAAVGNLKDPSKAAAAATSLLGDGYGDVFAAQWQKTVVKLRALGFIVGLSSMFEWFHKTVVELFDGVVGANDLVQSQVVVDLSPTAPQVVSPPPVIAPPAPAPIVPDAPAAPPVTSTAWSVWLSRSGDVITYHWNNMPSGMWSDVSQFRCWRYTEQTHPHGWATDGCGALTGYAGFPAGTGELSFTVSGATDSFSVEPWRWGPWLNVGESCGGDAGGNTC